MKHKIYVLDFDYTLFDAKKFRQDLANSLLKFNIEEKLFTETYNMVRIRDGKEMDYQPKMHLEILAKQTKNNYSELEKEYYKVINNCQKYLYSDSLPFIKKIKEDNNKLILLTFGNIEFQKLKVKYSGIENYFDKIYYTDKPKHELENKIDDLENVIFINDNPKEIKKLMTIYNKAHFIQIIRPNAKKYDLDLKNIKKIKSLFNNHQRGI